MTFTERIKQLREQRQLPQRKVAEALDIDGATYCKIERGERKAKREQLYIIAELLEVDKEELLTLFGLPIKLLQQSETKKSWQKRR